MRNLTPSEELSDVTVDLLRGSKAGKGKSVGVAVEVGVCAVPRVALDNVPLLVNLSGKHEE